MASRSAASASLARSSPSRAPPRTVSMVARPFIDQAGDGVRPSAAAPVTKASASSCRAK